MTFFSHVYRSKFWKPDDRWFYQLILICLVHTCNVKVKKSMDFLVWVGKTRGTLWLTNIKKVMSTHTFCIIFRNKETFLNTVCHRSQFLLAVVSSQAAGVELGYFQFETKKKEVSDQLGLLLSTPISIPSISVSISTPGYIPSFHSY